ncbi:MAG: hypothetical protein ACRYFU_04100 [Janthinobacterium lividum]
MKTKLPHLILLLAACDISSKAQSKPLDLSLGWNYAYADQGTGFANLNGWYGTLNLEVTHRLGVAFSHESYWGGYAGSGTNVHVYLGGVTVELRKGDPRCKPFLQPLGGVTRASATGSIQEQPTFQLAAGADITLKGALSLELIPAEYALTYGNGTALNTYEAAAGLQYTFRKKK